MTSAEHKTLDASVTRKRTPPRRVRGRSQSKPQGDGNALSTLWAKAQVAAQSARVLFERGDMDGAVNRAYYATFGAARAAVASVRAALASSKGHGTIFRRFAKHVVEERGFDPSLGRAFFHKQSHARWVADYDEGRIDEATARVVLGEMARLLTAVEPFLKRPKR